MRNVFQLCFWAALSLGLAACTLPDGGADTYAKNAGRSMAAPPSDYISKDSANKMISSYLAALPAPPDSVSPELHALLVSADLLRDYLSDTSIQSVKLMFAHTLAYINAGNEGVPAGYQSGALTLVFGGYNSSGDYVLAPGAMVPNHCLPCPPTCVRSGTAASDLFP